MHVEHALVSSGKDWLEVKQLEQFNLRLEHFTCWHNRVSEADNVTFLHELIFLFLDLEQLDLDVLTWTRVSYHLVLVVQYKSDLACSLMRRKREFVADSHCALNDLAMDDDTTVLYLVQDRNAKGAVWIADF
jgi:hypothetical protein